MIIFSSAPCIDLEQNIVERIFYDYYYLLFRKCGWFYRILYITSLNRTSQYRKTHRSSVDCTVRMISWREQVSWRAPFLRYHWWCSFSFTVGVQLARELYNNIINLIFHTLLNAVENGAVLCQIIIIRTSFSWLLCIPVEFILSIWILFQLLFKYWFVSRFFITIIEYIVEIIV